MLLIKITNNYYGLKLFSEICRVARKKIKIIRFINLTQQLYYAKKPNLYFRLVYLNLFLILFS